MPQAPIRIIGSFVSPYVRKVLALLHAKGLPYEIDPIVPFFGNDEFTRLSPLRRIPVLVDDRVTLADSSVICQYLEDRYPTPACYPADVADRAHARWLEEFADTRMGDVFIWGLFNQRVIRPFVWGKPTEAEVVDRTLADDIPSVMAYLEAEAPATGFRFGQALSIADIAVAAFFRNATFAQWEIDPATWPRAAAWIGRVLASPPFAALAPLELASLTTKPADQRTALAALGAQLTETTLGTPTPRRGVMSV